MSKLLLHLVARNGQKPALETALRQLADEYVGLVGDAKATVLIAHSEDSMRATGDMRPLPVGFDASLEITSESTEVGEALLTTIKHLASRLDACIHADLSAIQTGIDKVFIACEPTPIRFQYCMRRRADFSHTDYLSYYEETHSAFGLATQGMEGYTQFHIDIENSRTLATAAGFGVSLVDSVSELHIDTMEKFFAGIAKPIAVGNPGEDEDRFVDRARSIMWVSDAVYRAGYQ